MVEQIAQLSAGNAAMPEAAQPLTKPTGLNQAETKTFSLLMQDGSFKATSATKASAAHETTALQKAIATQGTEFHDRFQALDDKRQELIEADISDPMMMMWKSVEFSYQSTSLFTHLNLASGLAASVNNSFNSLFKNQS